MDKIKFFNQQLNSQIVMAEFEAEHLAKSIRLLSESDDYVAWATMTTRAAQCIPWPTMGSRTATLCGTRM